MAAWFKLTSLLLLLRLVNHPMMEFSCIGPIAMSTILQRNSLCYNCLDLSTNQFSMEYPEPNITMGYGILSNIVTWTRHSFCPVICLGLSSGYLSFGTQTRTTFHEGSFLFSPLDKISILQWELLRFWMQIEVPDFNHLVSIFFYIHLCNSYSLLQTSYTLAILTQWFQPKPCTLFIHLLQWLLFPSFFVYTVAGSQKCAICTVTPLTTNIQPSMSSIFNMSILCSNCNVIV